MNKEAKSRSHKNLSDLEPRKSNDDVRGGRLALSNSSVKPATSRQHPTETVTFAYGKLEMGFFIK